MSRLRVWLCKLGWHSLKRGDVYYGNDETPSMEVECRYCDYFHIEFLCDD